MNRRDFLRALLAGSALTTAGLYVPTTMYSFLWDNPLASEIQVPNRHIWGRVVLNVEDVLRRQAELDAGPNPHRDVQRAIAQIVSRNAFLRTVGA